MIKYKLKDNCISPQSETPMIDYLHSLGINQVESFLGAPDYTDELSPRLLTNIGQCVKMLNKGFEENKNFLLIVDCDVDGYTSASIFYRYFKNIYPNINIQWQLHEGKEHGLEAEKLDDIGDDIDYVIIPDAGSAQLAEQQVLLDRGKILIIIDHHDIGKVLDHPNLVVVNNQNSPEFANKDLSGAGVVLKVIQEYGRTYLTSGADDYYDLAALGIIADMMDMRELDNNYIAWRGLRTIRNKMFLALLEQQSYSINAKTVLSGDIPIPTKIDVAFYIAPLINGVIRAGSQEDKELLFKGFIEEPTAEYIDSEFRGVKRHETFYKYVARNSYNVKNRQNTQKEKCMQYLKSRIEANNLHRNQVIVVITSKDDKVPTPQNITGLVAMELLKEYGKPVLVLRPKTEDGKEFYRGSGRGKPAEGFDSFLEFMRGSKYCDYAEGHNFAFGASIAAEALDDFIAESNARLADVDLNSDFIEVDAIFNANNINIQMLREFAQYDYVYGNSIPQPRIVIKGVGSPANVRFMGADGTSFRVTFGGVSCVKFKDAALVEQIQKNERNMITVIGRPQFNEWNGATTVQLMADYVEVEPMRSLSLFQEVIWHIKQLLKIFVVILVQ